MQIGAKVVLFITDTPSRVAVAACATLIVVAAAKWFLLNLFSDGAPPIALHVQDCVITGALSAVLVWVLLDAWRKRRQRIREQLRLVADLNHEVRNALEVILASEYLPSSAKKTQAVLQSIARIDATLENLLIFVEGIEDPEHTRLPIPRDFNLR